MAAYQVKRVIRNRVVPPLATHYGRVIRTTANRLLLPMSPGAIPLDLAVYIGAYYHHSEKELTDAASGQFTILGRTANFDSIAGIDWRHQLPDESNIHLWRLKLAHLEILHSLVASGNADHQRTAIALVNSFTDSRSFASRDAFAIEWSPYSASHRLLALMSGLSIAAQATSITSDTQADLAAFARLDAGFLWRNIEHELRNNHTERNLAALCLYHLATGDVSVAVAKSLDRQVRRIIHQTVLADGMQVERSAMYQGLTVMSLRIFGACNFLSSTTVDLANERAEAAASAWLFLTHDDGEIALFNDSWTGEVPPPRSVLNPDIVPPAALPSAGYFRISAGHTVTIFDAGEIGPPCSPAHGHADFLAIEVDIEGRRFLVDPGTSQYSTGPQRAFERSSASHNGPRYHGVEPVEYFGSFKVGKLSRAEALCARLLSRLPVAAIGGKVRTQAGECLRVVCALDSGGVLVIDRWQAAHPSGVTDLLIPSEWHVDIRDSSCATAASASTETTLIVHQGRILGASAATWSRSYLRSERALRLTLEPIRNDSNCSQQLVFSIGVAQPTEVAYICREFDAQVVPKLRG